MKNDYCIIRVRITKELKQQILQNKINTGVSINHFINVASENHLIRLKRKYIQCSWKMFRSKIIQTKRINYANRGN